MSAKTKLYFLGIFLIFIAYLSTSAQDMVTYSDSWLDDETGFAEDPMQTTFFVVGSGVVEIKSEKFHSVDMTVTINSPQGRSATNSGTWTQQSEGNSLTVTAPIDLKIDPGFMDAGNYETLVQHFPSCPESHPPTSGGSTIPIGFSIAAFMIERRSDGTFNCNNSGCWYNMVSPCDAYCRPSTPRYFLFSRPPGSAGACFLGITPFTVVVGQRICSPVHAVQGNAVSCFCFDFVVN